jgi:murein DD-endopeptidase MepM/ murein hydrolase activator NlpD
MGKPVLAVADATVIDVWEGNDRDLGIGQPLAKPMLPDIGGNHVILDLGDGTYAMYGHLSPTRSK